LNFDDKNKDRSRSRENSVVNQDVGNPSKQNLPPEHSHHLSTLNRMHKTPLSPFYKTPGLRALNHNFKIATKVYKQTERPNEVKLKVVIGDRSASQPEI
jgi:hypothetical protein